MPAPRPSRGGQAPLWRNVGASLASPPCPPRLGWNGRARPCGPDLEIGIGQQTQSQYDQVVGTRDARNFLRSPLSTDQLHAAAGHALTGPLISELASGSVMQSATS